MMKFKHGDRTVEANDAAGVVRQMREDAFERSRTLREYMVQVAERARVQTGKAVRVGSEQEFIDDLVAAGLLEVVA